METTYSKRTRKIGLIPLMLFLILGVGFTALGQTTIIANNGSKTVITKGSKYKSTIRSGRFGNNFKIEHKGDIELNDDDTDVIKISSGGYLEISKTTFGSRQSILIESSGGGIRREYYEGRRKTDYEPEGRKWLAEILPDIVRSTGIAAESRVNRFYRKGGVDAVLEEIELLDGSYIKAKYGTLLLEKSGLSDGDLVKIVETLSDEIDSDYYLASVLKESGDRFFKNERTAVAYFDAVSEVNSDYYATSILKNALEDHDPSGEALSKIMEATENIGSDYYQSSILSKILDTRSLTSETVGDIIKASQDIGSDYYQTQLLAKALEADDLNTSAFTSLIEAVADVSSDYYMSTVFSKLLDKEIDGAVQLKIIELVDNKMSSDYYASAVLSKMIDEQQLESRVMEEFADAVADINSANYAASIIKEASNNDLSDAALISLIKASGDISSDYYKSSALQSLARSVRESQNSEVRSAYNAAAKRISSDTYYGRAMRAID